MYRLGIFIASILVWFMFDMRVYGRRNLPAQPYILAPNHTTYIDWLILIAAVKQPLRFIMHYRFMKWPLINHLFRKCRHIPIADYREDPGVMFAAIRNAQASLKAKESIVIFPEGLLTRDGKLGVYKGGIQAILLKEKAPVVPVLMYGLWHTPYSWKNNIAPWKKWPFGSRPVIEIFIGNPIEPEQFTTQKLYTWARRLKNENSRAWVKRFKRKNNVSSNRRSNSNPPTP